MTHPANHAMDCPVYKAVDATPDMCGCGADEKERITLTAPQEKALRWLGEHSDWRTLRRASPAPLARFLWPDSEAWQRRTRHYGSNHPGQQGGTMPMKAARLLHRLADLGLARDDKGSANNWVSAWTITYEGERLLEDLDDD